MEAQEVDTIQPIASNILLI